MFGAFLAVAEALLVELESARVDVMLSKAVVATNRLPASVVVVLFARFEGESVEWEWRRLVVGTL